MKLNEWKCDMNIDDVYTELTSILGNMIDYFKLIYKPRTESYDCDGDVDLYDYYDRMCAAERKAFDKAFVKDGKMTIRFGTVKGDFILPGENDNKYVLTSLKGCPKSVGGSFYCGLNQLTSLEGCPETVGGGFYCNNNQLTSLEGCPETVGGSFYCYDNQLTSLVGCPKSVGGSFYCYNNQLTSLKGCPKSVGGRFDCGNNKAQFTKKDVKAVCDVKKKIFV